MAHPIEISIPSTSLSSDGSAKQFTLYNITVRLPLRSFVVQKRYSEFAALHDALTSQVGSPPPERLPAKSWLKSTVSSTDFAHERQHELETYLRAIAESPDRQWRDAAPWRAFLNLPASSTTNSAMSAQGMIGHHRGGGGGGGSAEGDQVSWVEKARAMKACLREAQMSLFKRDDVMERYDVAQATEAGAAAKRSLVKAGKLLAELTDGLKGPQEEGLGDGEVQRRRDLLATARLERDGLERLSNTIASSSAAHHDRGPGGEGRSSPADKRQRAELFDSAGLKPGRRVIGAPLPETQVTRGLDNQGLLVMQQKEMAQQDQEVDDLTKHILRLKDVAIEINREVVTSSGMLDDATDNVDMLDKKLKVAGNRLKKLSK